MSARRTDTGGFSKTAGAAGFTLLELLVGVVVSSIVVMIAMMAWRPMSQSTLGLQARALDDTELRLVVEWLLEDLGGAESALPTSDPGELHLVREQAVAERLGAWSGGDAGVLYVLYQGDLVRTDLALSNTRLVASGLETFDVERVLGSETHVTLAVGTGLGARSVELVWPR